MPYVGHLTHDLVKRDKLRNKDVRYTEFALKTKQITYTLCKLQKTISNKITQYYRKTLLLTELVELSFFVQTI